MSLETGFETFINSYVPFVDIILLSTYPCTLSTTLQGYEGYMKKFHFTPSCSSFMDLIRKKVFSEIFKRPIHRNQVMQCNACSNFNKPIS